MKNKLRWFFGVTAIAGAAPPVTHSAAQTAATSAGHYPNRPLRVMVAVGAGGGTDVTDRIVAQKLAEQLGCR